MTDQQETNCDGEGIVEPQGQSQAMKGNPTLEAGQRPIAAVGCLPERWWWIQGEDRLAGDLGLHLRAERIHTRLRSLSGLDDQRGKSGGSEVWVPGLRWDGVVPQLLFLDISKGPCQDAEGWNFEDALCLPVLEATMAHPHTMLRASC